MYAFVQRYVVRSGDTLNSIAVAAGFPSVQYLLPVNRQIANPDLIYPGQVVNVPEMRPLTTYFVKPGDTLNSIIRNYNRELQQYYGVQITLDEVLAYNPAGLNISRYGHLSS